MDRYFKDIAKWAFGDSTLIGIVVNDVRTEILRQYVKYRASLLVETDAPTFDAALQNLKYCATVRRATANVYKSRVIVYKGGRCDVTEPDIPTELWGPDIEIRGPEHFRPDNPDNGLDAPPVTPSTHVRPPAAQPDPPAPQRPAKRPADDGARNESGRSARQKVSPVASPALRARKAPFHIVPVSKDDGSLPGIHTISGYEVMLAYHPEAMELSRDLLTRPIRVIQICVSDNAVSDKVVGVGQASLVYDYRDQLALCLAGTEGVDWRYGGKNGLILPADIVSALGTPNVRNPTGRSLDFRVVESHDERALERAGPSTRPSYVSLDEALEQFYEEYMIRVCKGSPIDV